MKKSWRGRLVPLMSVFALLGLLYLYTEMKIDKEVNEVQVVYTAAEIPPRTEITDDMLKVLTKPARSVPLNAITDKKQIVGKWTVSGYGIPENSFVYKGKVVDKSELPDAGLLELKEGEVAVSLLVDLETSLGNSIIPESHIDLYFRNVLYDKNNPKALLGPLAENVRVVAVKDSQATNVFEEKGMVNEHQQKDATKPKSTNLAKIYIFAVPEELSGLINKGKLLGDVFPVATGETYKEGLKVVATQNEIVDFINESSFKAKQNQSLVEGEQ